VTIATMQPQPEKMGTMTRQMVKGSAWMVAMRWGMRGIGLCSTVVLARLLVPEDYGLVAMGLLVLGFVEVCSQTNIDLALIQESKATKEHYDTAWTLEIIQGLIVASFLFILAPFAADFYREPRLDAVIKVLALVPLTRGFTNIGVVNFRKELNFAREFKYQIYSRLLQFCIVITLAFVLRNYWALVLGNVFGMAASLLMSYVMHSYRPRFSVARMRDIWSFSRWMLVFRIGQYVKLRFDSFLVGRINGTTAMGNYHVANEFAAMPTFEVVLPLGRALFPGYAKLAHDQKQADRAYLRVLAIVGLLCIPIGFGFSAVADNMVLVVFGAKWTAAAPLIEWLAIGAIAAGLVTTPETFLSATGRARAVAVMTWVQVGFLVPAVLAAAYFGGVQEIAIARTIVTVAAFAAMLVVVSLGGTVTVRQQVALLWRPLIASLAMFVAVYLARPYAPAFPPLALASDIVLGILVYAVCVSIAWFLSGRPAGPESMLHAMVMERWRRRR
jgi:O-antigen/teichoic acid export membrane protein